ncbi:MAG: hypothetical protein AABY00_03165 [Nanoarchaeota archaeon]
MGTFDLGGRAPYYTTPDGKIQFVRNDSDGPGAYDVLVGKQDHFYIPDRTLGDLANPEILTERMMQSLEAMCGENVPFILETHHLHPKDLHIALLQLRVQMQEEEIIRDQAYQR